MERERGSPALESGGFHEGASQGPTHMIGTVKM